MCGIAGYLDRGPRAVGGGSCREDSDGLAAARDAIRHRGPDDTGLYRDASMGIGLAHTRLSILDLSRHGHQPMATSDGRVVLVYNGEIYNFRELRTELEEKGVTFQGQSDTEVLLQLYLVEGEQPKAMLRRLNGIFAFALWDARTATLLVARDALGVKPLYITDSTERFAFASEIKALLPLLSYPLTEEGLDAAALHRYLTFLWCPGDRTPHEKVRKLGPGEAIMVRNGRVERRFKWYTLPAFRSSPPGVTGSDAISGAREHLRTAVHRQMVADVPVGASLSGGLDSSSIVAFAREKNPDILCFTIDTPGGDKDGFPDDLPYARRVADHLDVPLEVISVDSGRMAASLEKMVVQLDEPLADPAPLNVLFISQLARDRGIKVLLSGAAGDDLFTGYRRHRALMSEKWYRWLPRPVRSALARGASLLPQDRPLLRRLAKLGRSVALDGDARLVAYFQWIDRSDLMDLYTPAFREALLGAEAPAPIMEFLSHIPDRVSPLSRLLALEQRFFLTDHNLTYTDKMSMAAGVEVRVPFLDHELVEFAARIPDRLKQRGATGKWVLKRAMEPFLPRDVIYRSKTGFGAPLRRWMRVELRELLLDLLSEESLRRRGLFDPEAVHRLIARNDSGRIDASYTLLSLLCIELWCRNFLDQSTSHA